MNSGGELHATQIGEQGSWVVFCHGVFGQGKNFTQIARALGEQHRCLLLDMPQHGRSPWSPTFDYVAMADAVADALPRDDGPVTLAGHSMGGKIAMLLALRHPELLDRLCVVDVAPVAYEGARGFDRLIAGMRGLDLSAIEHRADADRMLAADVPDDVVRGFLLQNLRREGRGEGTGWRWQMNLEVIAEQWPQVAGWPAEAVAGRRFERPVLWVRGERSDYVEEAYAEAMSGYFPSLHKVTVKGAGHWVHSEQPERFLGVLRYFLDPPRP